MCRVSEKEAKEVRGGYSCKYCNYSTSSYVGMQNHMWAWHLTKWP